MKNNNLFWLIPILIIVLMIIEYKLILNFYHSIFKYTNADVFNEIINQEKSDYYMFVFERSIIYILQFIGVILSINIGLLFFNYKFKLKEVIKVSLLSFMSVLIINLGTIIYIIVTNKIYSTSTLNSISNKLNLTYYVNFTNYEFLELPLAIFNIEHLLFGVILIYNLTKIIKKNFIQSFLFTIKTYGIGVFIWMCFASIMELNYT